MCPTVSPTVSPPAKESTTTPRDRLTKELALFFGLLFVGLVLLPIGIYQVGQSVFGDYGGSGYADFFGTLSRKVRSGDIVACFLVLSPYLGWQTLRLLHFGWRAIGRMAGS